MIGCEYHGTVPTNVMPIIIPRAISFCLSVAKVAIADATAECIQSATHKKLTNQHDMSCLKILPPCH